MADQSLRRIAVVGGARIPFCRSNTLYADLTNQQMMTTALQGVVDKYDLSGAIIDEVVGGAVVTHSRDWNLAREAVVGTTLHPNTPGVTMMQACGTSLQAAMGIGAKIATGSIECALPAAPTRRAMHQSYSRRSSHDASWKSAKPRGLAPRLVN